MKVDVAKRFCENGSLRIIFATEALGMGVDIADVHQIVHIGPPVNLESMLFVHIFKWV